MYAVFGKNVLYLHPNFRNGFFRYIERKSKTWIISQSIRKREQ